jgi:hypothetical protein
MYFVKNIYFKVGKVVTLIRALGRKYLGKVKYRVKMWVRCKGKQEDTTQN